MSTATIDRTAGGEVELDMTVLHLGETVPGRYCGTSLEPAAWTEWRCPACRELYRDPVVICLEDGAPLEEVLVSLPFVWLG